MTKYIALLRGINVGGHNKVVMSELKAAFEAAGFANVVTYINSGNVIFGSELDEGAVKTVCEQAILDMSGLKIPVGVITAEELRGALADVPDWWNADKDSSHNAIFVIPPATAESVCAEIGETKPEHEKIHCHGKVIFWSAPIKTFGRTRLTKIVQNKTAYNAMTIRNANTTLKLLELCGSTS